MDIEQRVGVSVRVEPHRCVKKSLVVFVGQLSFFLGRVLHQLGTGNPLECHLLSFQIIDYDL